MGAITNQPETPLKPLLRVKQAAAVLGVSPAWVYAHASGARRPVLRAVRLGGIVRVHPDDLEEFGKSIASEPKSIEQPKSLTHSDAGRSPVPKARKPRAGQRTSKKKASGPIDTSIWIRTGRAAKIAGVKAQTIRRWAAARKIRHKKTEGWLLVHRLDLYAVLREKHTHQEYKSWYTGSWFAYIPKSKPRAT